MPRCKTPACFRIAVVRLSHPGGIYGLGEDDNEKPVCVPCARAYKEGMNRPLNEFEYSILDDADLADIEQIKEVLIG